MKRCERCNREFVGRSNRQKWCNICRPLVVKARPKRVSRNRRPPQFAFVPVERECELDGEVFVARSANARYCERCRALIEHLKYGPGSGHRELRAEWKPVVDTGRVRCARRVDCVFAEGKLGGLFGRATLGILATTMMTRAGISGLSTAAARDVPRRIGRSGRRANEGPAWSGGARGRE